MDSIHKIRLLKEQIDAWFGLERSGKNEKVGLINRVLKFQRQHRFFDRKITLKLDNFKVSGRKKEVRNYLFKTLDKYYEILRWREPTPSKKDKITKGLF